MRSPSRASITTVAPCFAAGFEEETGVAPGLGCLPGEVMEDRGSLRGESDVNGVLPLAFACCGVSDGGALES